MQAADSDRARDPLAFVAIVQGVLIVLLAIALLKPQPPPPAAPPLERAGAEDPAPTKIEVTDDRAQRARPMGIAPPAEPDPATPATPARSEPTNAVLHGSITGTDGAPVDSGWLSVYRFGETDRLARVTLRGDSRGYAVPGLEPGRYRMHARASGYREREDEVEVLPGVETVRHDLSLQKSWELRVLILTPEGKPLHERFAELRKDNTGLWSLQAMAIATADPPPPVLPPTRSRHSPVGVGKWVDGHGLPLPRLRLPERYAGHLELPSHRPLHVSAVLRTAVLATELVTPGEEEVTLTVPFEKALGSLCTVRLRVVDATTGVPASDAYVDLSDSQSSGRGDPVDAEGRVELRLQRPGTLELDVRARDRVARWYDLDLAPGQQIDLGDVKLFKPVEVGLRFEGIRDDAEVRVTLLGLDPAPHTALRPRSPRWGGYKGGTFTTRVAPGRYLLRASTESRIAQLEIDTANLGDEPLVVRMGGAASLRIVPPAGGEQVRLAILDGAGRSYTRHWITWDRPYDHLLPPGDYVAVVTRLDGTEERRAVSVPIGGAVLDLR